MPKIFLLISLFVLLAGCQVQAQKLARKKVHKAALKTITHSLCGTVVEKRGNQMPGPGRTTSAGQPVVREVSVFPVLTLEQVVSDEAGFMTDLKGALPLQTVQSGKDGSFCFDKLPTGRYSVLIHEEKGWYANSFDTQNHINPVIITKGKTATMSVQITRQAAY